jgi:hypothetical protein
VDPASPATAQITGHLVPIWQPIIGSSFQQWHTLSPGCRRSSLQPPCVSGIDGVAACGSTAPSLPPTDTRLAPSSVYGGGRPCSSSLPTFQAPKTVEDEGARPPVLRGSPPLVAHEVVGREACLSELDERGKPAEEVGSFIRRLSGRYVGD